MKMKHLTSKKAVGLLVVLVVGGIAAFGAYAFFSSTGSGTGTAMVGSSSGIQLTSAPVGTLYPGGADVPVTVSIHNPGSGDEFVGILSGSVATDDNGTPGDTSDDCLGSWFQVDPVPFNGNIGGGQTTFAGTVVRMLDNGFNQDACQGKSMTINWSTN